MKVNQEQIQQLYLFTRQHFVEWYDLQTEMVDHLANGIEQQWLDNPKLSFDEALTIEFKKFGVFGFSDVIEQRERALSVYYLKQVWKHTKAYFKLPKIIITLFCSWGLYGVLSLVERKEYITIPILGLTFLVFIGYVINQSRKIKALKEQTGKKWLFDTTFVQLGGLSSLYNIGIWLPYIDFSGAWSPLYQAIFSVLTVLYVLLCIVSITVVTPTLRKKFAKENPEYKII